MDEKVDKEIEGVLIKPVTPNTNPVKKTVLEYGETQVRKIKTRLKLVKISQIQIPDKEGEQFIDESNGEGNLDIGDVGKEVILLDEIEYFKEKEKKL